VTIESAERARKERVAKLGDKKESLEQLLKDYEQLSGEVGNFIEVVCDFASWTRQFFDGTSSEAGKHFLIHAESLARGRGDRNLKTMLQILDEAYLLVKRELRAVDGELKSLAASTKI